MELIRTLETYDPENSKFLTYLNTCLHNEFRMKLRDNKIQGITGTSSRLYKTRKQISEYQKDHPDWSIEYILDTQISQEYAEMYRTMYNVDSLSYIFEPNKDGDELSVEDIIPSKIDIESEVVSAEGLDYICKLIQVVLGTTHSEKHIQIFLLLLRNKFFKRVITQKEFKSYFGFSQSYISRIYNKIIKVLKQYYSDNFNVSNFSNLLSGEEFLNKLLTGELHNIRDVLNHIVSERKKSSEEKERGPEK